MDAIGPYRLLELLGSGAMGEVYKATDSKMFDRVVAVKLLAEKYARNEHARSRFKNEIQYAALLDHPNIVKIYDHGEIDGRLYFVMEFLDGPNLAAFIKNERNRLLERSVEIARQLAESLEFAHRHNVVHRDVKPTNVMIVQRGGTEQVKLVDFGIIHVEDSKMTHDGTQPGTKAYSSPEQLRNDSVDHRSDLFSLGIVLYELFTNVYPFDAPSEALITHYILQREPESPRKKNPALPAAIDALILKLLEKDVTQRPQTAGEVAESLRQQHRKLQSRWASTDPAEYENLDEITREAVDKLVAWARQKEADGELEAALEAFEKALRLAPDSDRIQRRIPKLRHRIESEKQVRDQLERAATALAAQRFPEAREHWHAAWLLSPDSEDVAAMQMRIEKTEKADPDDTEKRKFVDGHITAAEEALDEGRLDQARSEIVKILQRYPNEPLANFMLERILAIPPDVDYVSYRKLVRDARDLIDRGRFAEARACIASAQALWPGDEEIAGVDREVAERVEGELAALASRVEKRLMQVDDQDLEPHAALSLIASVRADIEKAKTLGSAAWIAPSSNEADRIERDVNDRAARAAALQREQDELRRKRIEMFLQRGRNQLMNADAIAKTVTTEPAPAIEAYRFALDSYESVLQDESAHAEALEARGSIEARLRALAARVEKARVEQLTIASALEAARAALAEAEVVGGARAPNLDTVTASLDEADTALDNVLALSPGHDDALAVREQVAILRKQVVAERNRRAKREDEARRVAEAEAKKTEEDKRNAEEARQQAEAKRLEEIRVAAERQAADLERKAKAKEAPKEPELPKKEKVTPPQLDARKAQEFEKGLKKYERLVNQGKLREAGEIQTILRKEASEDPELQARYDAAFPGETKKKTGSRRGLLFGSAAGLVAVAVAAWLFVKSGTEPVSPPLPPNPDPQEIAEKQAERERLEREAQAERERQQLKQEQEQEQRDKEEQERKDKEAASALAKERAAAKKIQDQVDEKRKQQEEAARKYQEELARKEAERQQAERDKEAERLRQAQIEREAKEKEAELLRNPPDDPSKPGRSTVKACLFSAARTALGAGYRIYFSVSGTDDELVSSDTGSDGCVSVTVPMMKATARVRAVYAVDSSGTRLKVSKAPAVSVTRGLTKSLDVRLEN